MQALTAPEIEDALTALPAWHRYGDLLARHIPVERGAQEGLLQGVRKVIDDDARFHVMDAEDGLLIYLGDAETHAVIPTDVETAARIDTIVDGTGDMF